MVSARTRTAVERLSADLAVLTEPHRLHIVRQLRRGPRTAGFLAEAIGISPSLASHHLAMLVDAGLVSRRQVGQFACYTADRRRVREVHRQLGRLSGALLPEHADGNAAAPC